MDQISIEEWVFVIESFFERKSYIAVQAAFRQRFNQAPPCKKAIQQNVTKYRLHRTILDRNKENYGRQRTARSEEKIELFRNILQKQPKFGTNLYWKIWQACWIKICRSSSPKVFAKTAALQICSKYNTFFEEHLWETASKFVML